MQKEHFWADDNDIDDNQHADDEGFDKHEKDVITEELTENYGKELRQCAIYVTLAKAGRLVKLFHHSNQAADILAEMQGNDAKRLQIDCKTRWNSA